MQKSAPDGSKIGTLPPADAVDTYPLWPAGHVPGAVDTGFDDTPKLWAYPAPGQGLHPAIIVLPGGGYTHLVTSAEGALEAHWLNQHGISAFVLQYRIRPAYLYPWPQIDGQRAIRFVRSHAAEWNLRPDAIGIWGFSAGGHMAGFLATASPTGDPNLTVAPTQIPPWPHDSIDQLSARPDFAIISYGRLIADHPVPGSWSLENLTGPHPQPALNQAISPILHVSKDTPPTFLYANEFDKVVDAVNSIEFYEALQKAHVPAELHVFETGPHGTHMGTDHPDKLPELAVFPDLLLHWLQLHHLAE